MKKIIGGLRYDTEKAILIGEYHTPGIGTSDFNYWNAGLYVTPKSGRYFLAGEGHGNTRFASSYGNSRGWGSDIIPMDSIEALDWAEKYLSAEEVEAAFSKDIQDA